MPAYLSDEWFDEVEASLQSSTSLRARSAGLHLSLHQSVTATPQGDVEYTIAFSNGTITLTVGPDARATVSFATSYPTAAAIAAGTITSQEAFQNGDLQVGGNIGELMASLDVLAELDDVLGPLRAKTTYVASDTAAFSPTTLSPDA